MSTAKEIRVRVKKAINGATYWSVQSPNGRKIATAGEQFYTASGTRRAFTTLATSIRAMTDEEFGVFMAGLREKITE